jgi:outer membrane lipoprotein-sorting protein
MLKPLKLLSVTAACLLAAASGWAITADDVRAAIAKGTTPDKVGLMIAAEADRRDDGFADSEVTLRMVLRNAQGQESLRQMRNQTLEAADKTVGDKTLIIFDQPRDVAGTAFLTFTKILDPDDQWLYLPSLKRVKRISSKNKSGPFMGSEFAYEDIGSQEVGKFDYAYLREEKCPDAKTDCFVVERKPLYADSGYTRQVVWMNAEHFIPEKLEFYDRKGDLLKTQAFEGYKQYLGQYWRAAKFVMVNHQTGKSTDLMFDDYKFRVGLKDADFTTDKLARAR